MIRQRKYLFLFIIFFASILLFHPIIRNTAGEELGKEHFKEYISVEKIASVRKIQGLWGRFCLSPDGKWIAFNSNIAGNQDIWIVPSEGGWPLQLTTSKHRDLFPVWSLDGKKIAYMQDIDGNEVFDIWVIPLSGRDAKNLTNVPNVDDRIPTWSPDGKKIAFASDKDGNLDVFVMIADGNEPIQMTQHPAPELYPEWSPDGSQIAYSYNIDGQIDIFVIPSEGGKAKKLPAYLGINNSPQWFPDGKRLAFLHDSSTEPRDIWICPIDGGEANQISFSFVGGLSKNDLLRGKLIHYKSFDGLKISAFLFKPRQAEEGKKLPVVVWVHGGPDWQFFDFWYPIALGFANQGFVVLCPNYRGGTGYGKEFEMMNDKDWGGNDLKDVVAGAQYLIKSGFVDPKKIAISGKSYGGYMTLIALTKKPYIWAAGVAFMAPVNMATMYQRYRGPAKSGLKGEMGTPEDDAQLYYDRSPINFVKNIKAPLLSIYGATDTRVTLAEWEQLKGALDKYKKSYEYIVFQDEGHFFGNTENLVHAMKSSVEFLRKCFRNKKSS